MTAALAGAVELLDRALGYTRVVLAGVSDDLLDRPTPCQAWSLGRLLAHMEDSLDAFTQAADGVVDVPAPAWAETRVDRLRDKACSLLGAWSGPAPDDVAVGGVDLASELLVATAALEITVHGWDVGRATGADDRIPEDLARLLLPVAHQTVRPADRGVRFADPVPLAEDAPADIQLLAFLGRS